MELMGLCCDYSLQQTPEGQESPGWDSAWGGRVPAWYLLRCPQAEQGLGCLLRAGPCTSPPGKPFQHKRSLHLEGCAHYLLDQVVH